MPTPMLCQTSIINFGGMRFPIKPAAGPGPVAQLLARNASRTTASALSQRFIDELPPEITTKVLVTRYPDILERMAAVSHKPQLLRPLVDEWLFRDDAHDPVPFDALVELSELRDYLCARQGDQRSLHAKIANRDLA